MISIVIITLNEEERICKLIDCLANQTYKDVEVIIIDSNSTDNTKKNALKYSKRFKKFLFYTLKKKGVCLARNTGADKAKGNYIFFMDADISFDNDFLEKSLQDLEKKKLDSAGVYMKARSKNPLDQFYYLFLNAWFYIMQAIYPHCVGSCMISTNKVHKKIKGFDETIKLAEDNDYVNRASKQFKYRMINTKVYVSSRRFRKEGRFKMSIKYLLVFFYRIIFGEIRTDIFKYRFAHYNKK